MRTIYLVILFGIILVVSFVLAGTRLPFIASVSSVTDGFHYSGFFETKEIVKKSLETEASKEIEGYWAQAGVTSHHLPTAGTFIGEFYKTLKSSKGPRDTFVILGPDHFEKCSGDISTSKKSWITPFGEVSSNNEIIDKIILAGASVNSECLDGEHAVGIQTIFISYLFPEALIVPITFSASTQNTQLTRIANALEEFKDEITVICSTDFSHTYPKKEAEHTDSQSEQMLRALDGDAFFLEYIDSPPAIKLTIELAKRFYSTETVILGRANSSDFNHNEVSTTGYINALFINKDYNK